MPHVDVDGRPVYYERHGDHPGPPLVLVMGVGGSCRGWLAFQVPELSKHRTTLIYDYPGVAESAPGDASFTTGDLARNLAGLLEALDVRRADVLGAFMGGMVAQELALARPERVERLVLVGSYARPDAKRRLLLSHWRDLARAGVGLASLVPDRVLWTLADETFEQTDLIETMLGYYAQHDAPLSAELFAAQCEACLAHDTLDRLAQVRHATLVVSGGRDQLTPPRLQQQLVGALPDARLATFAAAAHLVMVEAVEGFNRTVLQFLEEGR